MTSVLLHTFLVNENIHISIDLMLQIIVAKVGTHCLLSSIAYIANERSNSAK